MTFVTGTGYFDNLVVGPSGGIDPSAYELSVIGDSVYYGVATFLSGTSGETPSLSYEFATKGYVDATYSGSSTLTNLQTQVTFLQQDILQRPDITTYNTFAQLQEQKYTALVNSYNEMRDVLRALQASYVSLHSDLTSLRASFTGHTGNTGIHVS